MEISISGATLADQPLRSALHRIAGEMSDYGYRRMTRQLKREGTMGKNSQDPPLPLGLRKDAVQSREREIALRQAPSESRLALRRGNSLLRRFALRCLHQRGEFRYCGGLLLLGLLHCSQL